jgi:catechol 2,3-dioxygenase-like lactoylglutathione lyase family enzyme
VRRGVVLALLVLAPLAAPAARGADDAQPRVSAVGAIAITVSSVERAAAFYTALLGFDKVAERLQGEGARRARVVGLRLGDERLDLVEYLTAHGRPIPPDSRSHDRWFQHIAIIVSDMDRAYARLQPRVEHVSPAPQRLPDWNPKAGGIRAFYFKDPDGHVLEILWFPPGKGDARWHGRAGDRLFLGIDHTAIVVGDTARSLTCYRDALGLSVAGESENWGPEQERLNNVAGARLRITTLRAPVGPGIEFLEYLAPRDGRPIPADARPEDLAHWQTALVTADAPALGRALRGGACTPVTGVIGRAFLVRDPDGHALELVER